LQAQIDAAIAASKASSTNRDKVVPMTNDPLIPLNIDDEPMADLEEMTVWEHVEFWADLVYQFAWQL